MTFTGAVLDGLHGRMFVLQPEAERFTQRPLILLLHGAFEKHKKLLSWAELWSTEFDVALADLPGHGQSDPPSAITLDAYIDEVRRLLTTQFATRRVVIVGDSFGGLIGIALGNHPPANFAGVVALDPLLSTAKQWSILDLMPKILDGQPAGSFRPMFASEIMGMTAAQAVDRRYHHYLEGVLVPALVLAGSEPLGQRRAVVGPSLLDEEDRAMLRASARIKFGVIPDVGHQLVLQRPQETFAAARDFILSLT
jgi:pimeloyl-ACP methyl ester carboxylesterase